jgi:bifunctional DNA-binding transcriptional regulator/antitoxin component of YhaV-PrlF toxin-antitoxin module
MPQLVKGGKHTFGWSRVGDSGRIRIPPEALKEYGLRESERLIVVSGSRTSGGFGLASRESLEGSPLGVGGALCPDIAGFRASEGEVVDCQGRPFCWVQLRDGCIDVPPATLQEYGIRVGDKLLVIRGSGLAIGFAARGRIVEEALKHSELAVFE